MYGYLTGYFVLIPLLALVLPLLLLGIYMLTGMSFLDSMVAMSSRSAKLTCWHCKKETLASGKTCQHCGKELQ